MGAKGQSQKAHRQREAVASQSAIARGLTTGDVVGRGLDGRGWAECHRLTDVFGEQVVLVCEFDYPEQTRRHAVVVVLDLTNRGALSGIELADLARDRAGGPELSAALKRGFFAVPLPGHRGEGLVQLDRPANGLSAGSTHLDDLDAAQLSHRQLITAIEQARHRETPQQESPSRIGLVHQLWNDEPGEVWVAAQRLTGSGLPRQRVIEKLARLWQRHGPADPAAMESGSMRPGSELDAYLAALVVVR